ncbi:MAG TPA: glycosyltransferase family 87 protein [Rhizomicrobium sp.]|nr:glycosyltransferase family 87 protein [Rhizomicrobium sp.]
MDSLKPLMRRHWPLVVVAVLFGLYGWALVVATGSGHDGVIGPRFNALGGDWVIFLAAARASFTGDLVHIYDQAWITAATNTQFADWLSGPLPFPLFPYPPIFLLLVLPFAKLSVGWSLLLSQLAQFTVLAWALRKLAPDKNYPFFLIAAFLSPAAANNVLAGSNAVLVTALIVGGIALLKDRPVLAGALLGVVIFKPQFFPLLPLALIAAKQKRALMGMTASVAALIVMSAILFGPSLWLDWINVYLHPQQVQGVNATDWGHSWDESVSTCVALLGAPRWLANLAQGAAVLIAMAAVWRAFSKFHAQRLGVLLGAVLLASPHVSNYDLVLLAVAAVLMLKTLPDTARPLVLILPLAVWLAPLYNPPKVMALGLVTPVVILALMAWFLGFWSRQKPLPGKG